jgi:8-oxo-dGTP pyrophosphatase MutT (NUDIX family)
VADEPRFFVAAYAVVVDDGRVLLTRRRDSDDWVLPGGSVEEGEAPWEAAVREVAEETGLQIEPDRLVGVYAKRSERDLVLVITATALGGRLRASAERDRVCFFEPHELPAETSDRDRERIADALAERERAVLSVQPSTRTKPPAGKR